MRTEVKVAAGRGEQETGRGEQALVRLLDVVVVVPCGNVQHLKRLFSQMTSQRVAKWGRGCFGEGAMCASQ